MGMTIDKAIKILIAEEKCMEREISGIDTDCNNHNCDNCDLCYEQGNIGEQKETLKYAVEIMRKYQEIEQIIEVWHQDIYAKDFECISEVAEVVENENDDNGNDISGEDLDEKNQQGRAIREFFEDLIRGDEKKE